MTDMIEALRTFVRVGERLNFSAVATELNASHTTIARRIDFLETRFAARLFHRSTRALALTDEGLRLLDHGRAILEDIEQAELDLSQGEAGVSGVVRVGVTTALGLHYAERLATLHARHPSLRIEFAVADWRSNMAEEGLDLALRVGEVPPGMEDVALLGPVDRVLVAAPAYLEERGAPDRPEDLHRHECIGYGYGPSPAMWDVGGLRLRVSGCFRANSSEAVYRAVLSGLGIGLLPHIQVRHDLAAGRLRPLLDGVIIDPLILSVIHRFGRTGLPPRIRVVRDFLIEHFPQPH
ncbi:MAG TPA: LysR substrate-binding domain-containing protein [Acetobacteraceae bacterium]|nr:LysR substrate-binding domain-containing protein [Acetobacteraceae bacterium]